MEENQNGFNLDLLDLRGSEGAFDYCNKTNIIIYSVGSMIVFLLIKINFQILFFGKFRV
jgi:hypothetical protein